MDAADEARLGWSLAADPCVRPTKPSMSKLRRTGLLVVGCSLVPAGARAHEPYEHHVATIISGTDPIRLVKRWTDGITGADPVSLQLRDAQGATVASSEMGIDIAVHCMSKRACLVFRFGYNSTVLFPEEVLVAEGRALRPAESAWLKALGPAVHVWNHWWLYIVSAISLVLPILVAAAVRRAGRGVVGTVVVSACACVGAALCFVWVLVALTTEMSIGLFLLELGLIGWTSAKSFPWDEKGGLTTA
jgi:hypothetical protein